MADLRTIPFEQWAIEHFPTSRHVPAHDPIAVIIRRFWIEFLSHRDVALDPNAYDDNGHLVPALRPHLIASASRLAADAELLRLLFARKGAEVAAEHHLQSVQKVISEIRWLVPHNLRIQIVEPTVADLRRDVIQMLLEKQPENLIQRHIRSQLFWLVVSLVAEGARKAIAPILLIVKALKGAG